MTLLIFFLMVVGIYFLSRYTINELFHTLRLFIPHEKAVMSIVSLIFLPGTIVHELSHFVVAIALMLRVRDVSIFPKFEHSYIKLGSVLYEKKDYIRGILVGIAPIFAGLFFFWFISHFKLFPSFNIVLTGVLGYLIFIVSSTMFSSKQDLVDLVFIIPFLIVLAGVMYVFDIRFDALFQNKYIVHGILSFVNGVNIYLLYSLIAHVVLVICFKGIQKIAR